MLFPLSFGVEALVRLRLKLSDDVLEIGREFAKFCNESQGQPDGRKSHRKVRRKLDYVRSSAAITVDVGCLDVRLN